MQVRDTERATVADTWCPWLLRPGVWFWSALVIGAVIRLCFVVFTEGTYDVGDWERHAAKVRELGVIGYYHANPMANHPPFISVVESLLLDAARISGIPFRVLLRGPFALIDAGTTLLLLGLLRDKPWRFAAAACYWLNPLAMIFSGYHGNTDTAVAFSVLLCVWLLSRGKPVWAGVALGAGLWIKLPGVLAIPALVFFIPGWRRRLLFLLVAGATAVTTYLPALFQDARVVYANVFAYRGMLLQTLAGVPVWGSRVLISSVFSVPAEWQAKHEGQIVFFEEHSQLIAILLLLGLSWLRRPARSASEVCATIAAVYTVLYGFTDYWAFQYLAWSLPFWFFLRPWFFVPALILANGYVYSLYWLLCGNPWLLGKWDFVGHFYWPKVVIGFRNLAMLFFFISACVFLISAAWKQISRGFKSGKDSDPGSQESAAA